MKKNSLFIAALLLLFPCGLRAGDFKHLTFSNGSVSFDKRVPSGMGVQLKADTEGAEYLDLVRDLGMKWVRRGFIWEAIEQEKGICDFSKYDEFVRNCEERGLAIIGCIAFSNKLYGHVKEEAGRAGYAKLAAALVQRYKGKNVLWEIWNEPNTMTFWGRHGKVGNSDQYAEEYTNLVKVVVPAMKQANPDCIVLAGSVSNMWTESYKWMHYCFEKGMLDIDWDIWSVHPYGLKSPEDYIDAYGYTRELMKQVGGNTSRMWINSERGFPIGEAEGYAGGDPKMTYEYQAWHLVRQYMIDLLEGLPVTIWYEWGGKEGFALYNADKTVTPAFNACKVLIEELNGYYLDKRLATENQQDFVLQFKNDDGSVKLVAWTSPPKMQSPDKTTEHTISLPVSKKKGELPFSGIYGKKGKLKVKEGIVDLRLCGSPIYIKIK